MIGRSQQVARVERSETRGSLSIVPGLRPGYSLNCIEGVDGRDKPGHDDVESHREATSPARIERGQNPGSPVPHSASLHAGYNSLHISSRSDQAARAMRRTLIAFAFFMACGVPPWRELVKTRGIVGTPLLEINTKFIKAVTYGERITIATHVEEWRAKVFVQLHRVTRGDDLICEGREIRTFVKRDPENPDRLRSIPVPDDIKALCS